MSAAAVVRLVLGALVEADLVIRKDREFSRTELERRVEASLFGMPVCTATAEDTVLAKLESEAMSGSDRHRPAVPRPLGR